MIELSEQQLQQSKDEMKKTLAVQRKWLSNYKKRCPKKERGMKQDRTIDKQELWLYRFRISEMLPVRVEGLVINYLLYQRLLKKLKHCRITEAVQGSKLIINYESVFSSSSGISGSMELYDLSKQLPPGVIEKLPKAVIRE